MSSLDLTTNTLDNTRLLDQAQSRLQAMTALYDASLDIISQAQEPERLFQTLVRRAVELLRAEAGAIYILEPDRQTLRLAITYGYTEEFRGTSLRVGDGVAGKIVESGQSLIIDDYRI